MKIYISGAITDAVDPEQKFAQASDILKAAGHEPLNPMAMFPERNDWDWVDYMLADLKVIWREADAMLMLPCWTGSKGARHEHFTAQEHGLKIYYSMDEVDTF